MPLSTMQRATEAASYKSDTGVTPTPSYYYYDLVLKHEMSVKAIYIFGDHQIWDDDASNNPVS